MIMYAPVVQLEFEFKSSRLNDFSLVKTRSNKFFLIKSHGSFTFELYSASKQKETLSEEMMKIEEKSGAKIKNKVGKSTCELAV